MATVTMDVAEMDALRDSVKAAKEEVKQKEDIITNMKANAMQVVITTRKQLSFMKDYELDKLLRQTRSIEELKHKLELFWQHLPDSELHRRYENLDHVKEELRSVIRKEYEDEILQAKSKARDSDIILASNTRKLEEINSILKSSYEKKIRDIDEKHEKEVNELIKKVERLQGAKDVQYLQEQLNKLREQNATLNFQLNQEKAKKWYQKLF